VPLSAEGNVIGEAVSVTQTDCDGPPQRVLRAICKKADGNTYEVALADVEFPAESKAAPYMKAYRRWLGIAAPEKSRWAEIREKIRQTKARVGELELSKPVEPIVLGVKKHEAARCACWAEQRTHAAGLRPVAGRLPRAERPARRLRLQPAGPQALRLHAAAL
jgi:hypothetical protein